jgi:RNA polymerase sigma factor for flagellar operon FliA
MQQQANRAERELQTQLGRAPSKEELAKKIGITEDEMMGWEQAFQANVHQSLDSVYDDFSVWFVSPENTPEENISDSQLRDVLKSALTTLPEREALVIQLYYVEELNVYEIAEVLEVTTGRVSQIKKAAIGKLRTFMQQVDGDELTE